MSKISIIIPVYNRNSDLMIPIKSVLKQDYSNWELILVDDGSTDGTSELCDILAVENINIKAFHQKNAGVSAARNLGIEQSSGEYILFLDSDDWIESDTLSRVIARIENDRSDMVAFAMQIDRYCAQKCHSMSLLFGADPCLHQADISENFVNLYYKDYLCSSCTKLFRKSIIDRFGLRFRSDLVMYEDFYFVMDYLENVASISIENHAYYHYRMDETVILINKRKTNDLLKNLDVVACRIDEFTQKLGIRETKEVQKIIFEFYIMYLYKLFVTDGTRMSRIAEIKRLFQYKRFIKSEVASRGADTGKFYTMLRWGIQNRNALIIYALFQIKYR